MLNQMPKVTVLMAVYNGERYLHEAIESILNQTFQDFEFLIINDGSQDSTKEIIASYQDTRIKLIDNEQNLGLTKSLNKGWKLAKGEFIARQDADDISEPERLAKQVTFLETNPDVVLVGSWYRDIDERGDLLAERKLPCSTASIRWEILFYCPFVHSAVMFRTQTVSEQIGFYDESFSYAQDYDLWWRIARKLEVANINEYLLKLRINPLSMTATYGNLVDDEPLNIKVNNINYLLDFNEVKAYKKTDPWQLIYLVWIRELNLLKQIKFVEIERAVTFITQLRKIFDNHYKINNLERKTNYQTILDRIIPTMLNLSFFHIKEDRYSAWCFFIKALTLRVSILREYSNIKLMLKLFLGIRLYDLINFGIYKKNWQSNRHSISDQ